MSDAKGAANAKSIAISEGRNGCPDAETAP
jgi:hypothetical protein